MREIPLTQGKIALVDDKDFEIVAGMKWQALKQRGGRWYAVGRKHGSRYQHRMHRMILQATTGVDVDHINGDGLDNRRSNLRICETSENLCNRGRPANNKSGFKGVSWFARDKRWQAHIASKRKQYNLGCFDRIEDAARAYNDAALVLHGRFAKLNELGDATATGATHGR